MDDMFKALADPTRRHDGGCDDQLCVNPIVLGAGRTMFEGIKERVKLKFKKERAFANGNVVLWYEPA